MPHDPAKVRRARTLSRLVGATVGMVFGILYGAFIITNSQGVLNENRTVAIVALLCAGVAGAASPALAAPLLSVDPYIWLVRTLDEAPASQIVGSALGLVVALLVAALLAVLLNPLPWGLGVLLSLGFAVVLVYVGVRTGTRRRDALAEFFHRNSGGSAPSSLDEAP